MSSSTGGAFAQGGLPTTAFGGQGGSGGLGTAGSVTGGIAGSGVTTAGSGGGSGGTAGDGGVPVTLTGGKVGAGGSAAEAGEAGAVGMDGESVAGAPSAPRVDAPGQNVDTATEALWEACRDKSRSAPATLYLSADDSNSMASPVIARRMIRSGLRVPATLVRAYEFLNYYSFSFEPAAPGEVRVVPQLASCPVSGQLSFQVALQSEARSPDRRRSLNVTFVLDTSGSMAGQPIALEQAAVRAVASQLRSGDLVSAVTWNTTQTPLLAGHVVSGPDDPTLVSLAGSLTADGGTDLDSGLRYGYELAESQFDSERINRVILISDGIANVGVTNEEMIGRHADDEEGDEGIYLTGIGVGDGVNDTLMNVVTDAGRGAYVYLDSIEEAQKMLVGRFLSVVDLAARAVRLELKLPWYFGVEKFYGEAISTDPTKVRPQHLGPNDAMLFFQILKACDPSLIHGDDRVRVRATWQGALDRRPRSATIDATLNDLAGDDRALAKAAAVAGYAEALALSAAEAQGARAERLTRALETVRAAPDSDRDPDLLEIATLIEAYMTVL